MHSPFFARKCVPSPTSRSSFHELRRSSGHRHRECAVAQRTAPAHHDLTERTADLTEALEQQTATSEVLQVISSSPGDLEPVFADDAGECCAHLRRHVRQYLPLGRGDSATLSRCIIRRPPSSKIARVHHRSDPQSPTRPYGHNQNSGSCRGCVRRCRSISTATRW